MPKSRGIRNNNPGNIRKTGDEWKGLSDEQTDEAFWQFVAPEWGIRALARILVNYQVKHGFNTISQMIRRWAPPNENDTPAYIKAVCQHTGRASDDAVDMQDHDFVGLMVEAIIQHENGEQPYSSDIIDEGLSLAGIPITLEKTS